MEPEFVGEDRQRMVGLLGEMFDRVVEAETPVWVQLVAGSGWGKTRLAREFYKWLAAERQESPSYWPADVLAGSGAQETEILDAQARHKQVAPPIGFAHVPESLPSFFWWGIACGQRNGQRLLALAQDLEQLEAHAEYLDDRWRTLATRRERWAGAGSSTGRTVLDESAMEVASAALGAAMGASVPGLVHPARGMPPKYTPVTLT